MKHILIIVLSLIFLSSCDAQIEEKTYLYFDINSLDTFKIFYEGIESENKKYRKINESEAKVNFKILNESFSYDKLNSEIKIITKSEFQKINFVSIEFLNQKWKESSLFSKQNVFKQIYLVEVSDNEKYKVYSVNWVENLH